MKRAEPRNPCDLMEFALDRNALSNNHKGTFYILIESSIINKFVLFIIFKTLNMPNLQFRVVFMTHRSKTCVRTCVYTHNIYT